jgi:small multidrug resistance family-3 protein
MKLIITAALFAVTAFAEIIGCYLPYLWLREGKTPWLLVPSAGSLALFVWLLTLHPTAAGRVYAAYGGMYVTIAFVWLRLVDGVQPDRWDYLGVALCLTGMAVIMLAPHQPGKADVLFEATQASAPMTGALSPQSENSNPARFLNPSSAD